MVRCFIIGAGGSVALENSCIFALPTDQNFFKILEQKYPKLYNEINVIIPLKDLKFNKHKGLEKISNEIKEKKRIELEKHFYNLLNCAVYRLICKPSYSDRTKDYLSGTLDVNESPINIYDYLLSIITYDDFFICLNYDLLLDRTIMKKRSKENNYNIDYGEGIKLIPFQTNINIKNDNVYTLFKPHGSLNWKKNLVADNYFLELNSIKYDTNNWHINLTLPINKENNGNNYSNKIWEASSKRMKDVDHLIIIGCSLNKEDNDLWKLINDWIFLENGKEKKISICSKNEKKAGELFTQDQIKMINFKSYPDGLTPDNINEILERDNGDN